MQNEFIVSGFGGQGVLFTGKVLAYSGLEKGLEVTWIPSYGPEMRGGTANCTVVISDEEIGSPLVNKPRAALVMNQPSLDKYEPLVQPGGVMVVNTSLTNRATQRKDIHVVEVPATTLAEELGEKRLANLVMLGALAAKADFVSLEMIESGLRKALEGGRVNMLEVNMQALHKGAQAAG